MATDDAFDRWFVLNSADAVANRSFTTEEILAAHSRGALRDRTVIYHQRASRREALTVKELADRAQAKK